METTEEPTTPKIIEGRRYLDVPENTTLATMRETSRGKAVEVLTVADEEGTVLYAPMVGEAGKIDLEGVGNALRNRVVSHNHPSGTMPSLDDLREAIEHDMARIEAVMPDGTVLGWSRPKAGWPDPDLARRAYITGFNRAVGRLKERSATKALSRREIRDETIKQVGKALSDRRIFGDNALHVETTSKT